MCSQDPIHEVSHTLNLFCCAEHELLLPVLKSVGLNEWGTAEIGAVVTGLAAECGSPAAVLWGAFKKNVYICV